MTRAYVGLGANLGDRERSLLGALARMDAQGWLVTCSTFRETDPVGVKDQPKFLNAVAELRTEVPPRALLERLLAIERELGRDRKAESRWGPRLIDLDLLLYGDEIVDEPGLTLPHPLLAERRFVLEPLVELDPDLTLPDGRRIVDLLAAKLE